MESCPVCYQIDCECDPNEIAHKMAEDSRTIGRLKAALEKIRDSGQGSFDATTGEGHAFCRDVARKILKELEGTESC